MLCARMGMHLGMIHISPRRDMGEGVRLGTCSGRTGRMGHYHTRRRHGLYPHEFGPVFRAIKQRLLQLLEGREYFLEAEALFRVLWRFENCKLGRPRYPEEISWQLISELVNGPFQPIEDILEIVTGEDPQ